jgi:hypothetical protein
VSASDFICNGFFELQKTTSTNVVAGLPDFYWYMIPKTEKMYQMNKICTQWSLNIPNVRKTFQIAIKYINTFQSKALKNLPKLVFLV